MTDWMRTLDPAGLLAFSLTCLAWGTGGWLAVRAWFGLRPGERLLGGLAAGFIVNLTLVNLFTPLAGLPAASALSAVIILAAGLWAAWRTRPGWAALRADLRDWPQVALLLVLTLLFETAQRGVSLFDEYLHLPMVSIMGTGLIPPPFYLNPELTLAYHYGLQVFAAVLESLARFFPWSAWDLTRGLAIALTINLGWLWVRRGTGRGTAATLGALVLIMGGGARWLLLLLPGRVLNWISAGVQLSNSGADTAASLTQALTLPWPVEGGGAFPFPFAYHTGVFTPQFFILGSTGALPALTALLLLLLVRPDPDRRSPGAWLALSLILANLALSAEHLFAFLWGSLALIGVVAVIGLRRQRRPLDREQVWGWLAVLAISAVLSIFQGGFITETVRSLLAGAGSQNPSTSNLYGFNLRWPPAIVSAHLGLLSPFNLRQLVALLAEMGPVLLAGPLATVYAWRAARRGHWLAGGLGLAALLMLVFTLFVAYGVDRSSTRFASTSLWLWLALAFPLVWRIFQRAGSFTRAALGLLYAITLYAGLVMFAVQLTAFPNPVPAYFINGIDLSMSRKYWNRLETGAQVLDWVPERAVTLFGRASKVRSEIYVTLPEWKQLMTDPTPQNAAQDGFSYIYMDDQWWQRLSQTQRETFQQPCVRLVDEVKNNGGEKFRRLYNIQSCK